MAAEVCRSIAGTKSKSAPTRVSLSLSLSLSLSSATIRFRFPCESPFANKTRRQKDRWKAHKKTNKRTTCFIYSFFFKSGVEFPTSRRKGLRWILLSRKNLDADLRSPKCLCQGKCPPFFVFNALNRWSGGFFFRNRLVRVVCCPRSDWNVNHRRSLGRGTSTPVFLSDYRRHTHTHTHTNKRIIIRERRIRDSRPLRPLYGSPLRSGVPFPRPLKSVFTLSFSLSVCVSRQSWRSRRRPIERPCRLIGFDSVGMEIYRRMGRNEEVPPATDSSTEETERKREREREREMNGRGWRGG